MKHCLRTVVGCAFVCVLASPLFAQSGKPNDQLQNSRAVTIPTASEKSDDYNFQAEAGKVYQCDDNGRPFDPLKQNKSTAQSATNNDQANATQNVPKQSSDAETIKPSPSKAVVETVIIRAVLTSKGNVADVKADKDLPNGLTGKAIIAACRIKFKPAIKDGHPVSQAVKLEFKFEAY